MGMRTTNENAHNTDESERILAGFFNKTPSRQVQYVREIPTCWIPPKELTKLAMLGLQFQNPEHILWASPPMRIWTQRIPLIGQ